MRNSSKSKVIHRQDDDSLRRRIAKLEAENRLLSNEMAEIRDLLDGSVQGIMIHRDYKPLYANAAFAAILGYSGPAEIMQIGTTLSLFAEEEREKAQTIAEARRQGGDAPDHYEYQGLRKDGSLVWLSNTVRVVNWDGEPAIQSTIIDISVRKQAEEALRESGQRFKFYTEVASDWLWEMDQNYCFNYFSDRFEDAAGVAAKTLLGKTRWEKWRVASDADAAKWDDHIADIKAHRSFSDFVYSYQDKQGEVRFTRTNGKPVFAEDGKFAGYRGTGSDITAEMSARTAAESAHSRLFDAIESIPAAFFIFDKDEKLLLVNSITRTILPEVADRLVPGAKYEDIIRYAGENELVPTAAGRTEEWIRERLKQFRNPQPYLEQERHDGRWLQIIDRKTSDGGTVCIRIDITDLKKREKDLQQSEERFRNLLEGSIQGIVVHRHHKAVFANQAYADTFGFESPEEILQLESMMSIVAPSERQRILAIKDARMLGEEAPTHYEFEGVRKAGKRIWLDSINTVVDWDGEPAILSTQVDVTERKRLEDELRHSQKMEAIGQLAGGVAHDFNNLLQVVSGFTLLAMDDIGDEAEVMQDLKMIEGAAARAAELTSQLLAFSRRQILHPVDVNLNEIVSDLVLLLQRVFDRQIELVVQADAELNPVRADPGMIQQVLMNLCVNARDAILDRGTITIETRNILADDQFCADQPWAKPGPYSRVSVSDTGTGIPADILEHLFEPFYTTKEVGKGTGLGLSTVYGIVEQHDGNVTVETEVGKGSTFHVYLPAQRIEQKHLPVSEAPTAAMQAGSAIILIVEDEPAVRKFASRVLENNGYRVLVAEDGEQALDIFNARADAIDLVILDVIMPKLSGVAVFDRIKTVNPQMKVIICSGYTATENDPDYQLVKKAPKLVKPFKPSELLEIVRDVIAGN